MKTILAQMMAVLFLVAIVKNTSFSQGIIDEDTRCIVSDVSGKVTYKDNGSSTDKPVEPGTLLSEDATVIVNKKASFTLVKDDRSMTISKKGNYQVAALAKEVEEKGETSKFAAMAFAAKGYGTTDTIKKAKGWGDKDSLLFKNPFEGKILLQPITFRWTSIPGNTSYHLIVYQSSQESPILSAIVANSSFSIDPSQLDIKTGETCYAQVMLANDNKTASKVISFTFVSAKEEEMALATLIKDKEYNNCNAIQKILLEAFELDSQNFKSSAAMRYQKAMKMDSKNVIASQIYVAFLKNIK